MVALLLASALAVQAPSAPEGASSSAVADTASVEAPPMDAPPLGEPPPLADAGVAGRSVHSGWQPPAPGSRPDDALFSLRRMLLPGSALLILAGVAYFLARRQRRGGGQLRVVESISLGPKRSLVVAQVGDEVLVLGCSEAGISLLTTRPANGALREVAPRAPYGDTVPPTGKSSPRHASVASAYGTTAPATSEASARHASAAAIGVTAPDASTRGARSGRGRALSFLEILEESAEDEALRRRLAEGLRGSVR